MANGPYNNIIPIPGNGADRFGDRLVGNQFTDGTSQFTLGNFDIFSNVAPKDSRDFSLGNFSEPITLDTLQLEDVQQSKLFVSNNLEVFINFNRSRVTNFTLYGSLRERFKVAVQNVIKKFPAALRFNSIRRWSDYNTGNTATNIVYEPNDNQTFLDLNLYTLYNPFSLDFTKSAKIYSTLETSELRNITLAYKKYSLYYNDTEYPLQYLRPVSANTETGILTIAVNGNPFNGRTNTTQSFFIKPNTVETEKSFNSLDDVEKFLVERKSTPKYTAQFDQPRETESGKLIKSTTSITWPTGDEWNILISGNLFTAYLNKLYDIGDSFDRYKTNLVSRFLTTAAFKEFDTFDEKVDKILKIYGRSFDEIKKYIDGLAYMTNVTYDGKNNIPNELLKNFARTLGWSTPSAIEEKGFLESIFYRNTDNLYSGQVINQTPAELDTELYRRLLVNTAYLFKSKGTRRGIEFMLRFIGAPEALIEFNEHVYVAGQPINMQKFDDRMLYISGGTYSEQVPAKDVYFSAVTDTFPPLVVTGFTFGSKTVIHHTTTDKEAYPVNKDGYPTVPKYGADAYFEAGAGWFEETVEHRGKRVVDYQTSVFTGNTPVLKTRLNQFTYGEPYLNLYRKFPDTKLGFSIVRTPDNKKSWVKKDSEDNRHYTLQSRGTDYVTQNDDLVINVKNVDLFLNIGQGLEWGVWNFSRRYNCPLGPKALLPPYPTIGGPDWTEIVADASKVSFSEFANKFWRVFLNVKNRLTIDDGHAGGYPTLLMVYLDYLNSEVSCGVPSTKYTYEKMVEYVENMGGYWMRLIEQFIPATTIWQGGVKHENSIFHRDKFVYKHEPLCDDTECFGSFVTCCEPILNEILVDAANECGGLFFSGATWYNKITLGGTEYTGDIYYSSTTIYDIPTTGTYLDDIVSILSGITQNTSDPNHLLEYYLINNITEPHMPAIDDPNCVIIQGPCGTGEAVCDCPPGYEYDVVSDLCVTYSASTVTTGETISAAAGSTGYGALGARFCIPGTYTTCGSGMPAPNFNVIGGAANPFWDCNGTSTDGRLNQVGVNNTAMIATTDWFGFSRCINAPSKGEYLFALAGDDEIRATLNGVTIVHNPWNGSINSRNFNYWWVWPVTLNAGENTLILEGANGFAFGPASFGCEIVGPFSAGTFTVNTDFDIFSTQAGIDMYTGNTIFSSGDEIGNTFNTQTNTCPAGYTYDLCTDSCMKTVPTTCITYPAGNDAWNANNGVDPHFFKSEICLNITNVQVSPIPLDTDIYAFYDTSSTPYAAAQAARNSINTWTMSISGFTGNVYHIPLADERWLKWATIPISGGTFLTPTCCDWQNITYGNSVNFSNLPSGTTYTGTSVGLCSNSGSQTGGFYNFPQNLSTDVLMFTFIDESGGLATESYHGARGDSGLAQCYLTDRIGSPPGWEVIQGVPYNASDDWNSPRLTFSAPPVVQPTPPYSEDFSAFTAAHAAFSTFKGFMYPIVYQDQNENMMFPLHVYGAMFSGTVDPSQLIENPTVVSAGGTLTAITMYNPYSALTATNTLTGYVGAGLNNFGWGAQYNLGVTGCATICGDCTDTNCFSPNCPTNNSANPCNTTQRCHRCNGTPSCVTPNACSNVCAAAARNLCADPALFFQQQFQQDLAQFLEGSTTLSLFTCEICTLICGDKEFNAPLWNTNNTYNFGDIIIHNGNFYEWVSGESGTADNPDNYNPQGSPTQTTTTTPGGPPAPPGAPECWPPPCGWQPFYASPGGIPFLGGNNFTEGDDCSDYEEVPLPVNPPTTGITVTVDPVTFKDGITNIGAQDCFESNYSPCEELVDPCACTVIFNEENGQDLYFAGDVVCCPEDADFNGGVAFILIEDATCALPQRFPGAGGHGRGLCTSTYPEECWMPCDGVDLPVVIATNDTADPCDPEEPAPPPVAVCGCDGGAQVTLPLDFYEIALGDVPTYVNDWALTPPAEIDLINWTTQPSTLSGNKWFKAHLNPCCLGDTFILHILTYKDILNPAGVHENLGEVTINLNITDNTVIDFYLVEYTVDKPYSNLYMSLPNTNDATIMVTDNPSTPNDYTTTPIASDFQTLNGFTLQIGMVPSSFPAQYSLQHVVDSNYLTDNGSGTINAEPFTATEDRYWHIPGGTGTPPSAAALNSGEIGRVIQFAGGTHTAGKDTFNIELELSCDGTETTNLIFAPNVDFSGTITPAGQVPVTNPCPTILNAQIPIQDNRIIPQTVNLGKAQATGNLVEIPIETTILDIAPTLDYKNYEIRDTEIFMVENTVGAAVNTQVPYNEVVFTTGVNGVTPATFATSDNKEVVQLRWLNELSKNITIPQQINFLNESNQLNFGYDLLTKTVGQLGKEKYTSYMEWAQRSIGPPTQFFPKKAIYDFIPRDELSPPSIQDKDNIELSDNMTVDFTRGYYTDSSGIKKNGLEDDSNNYRKLFKGFEITPFIQERAMNSQNYEMDVPFKNRNTDLLITTQGSYKEFIATERSLSALTPTYSAYTNLSAFTNTENVKFSPDKVFDLSCGGSAIDFRTSLPYSDRINSLNSSYLIGNSDGAWGPVIPTEALNENCGPVNIPRSPNNYLYYEVIESGCYEIKWVGSVYMNYMDEGFNNYVQQYRSLTNNLFPKNDLELTQLINSGIINGKVSDFTPSQYLEGNVVNNIVNSRKHFYPAFGRNPNTGLLDFSVNLYIERVASGTTSATTILADYRIAGNGRQGEANQYLTLPVNSSLTKTENYSYSAASATSLTTVFERNFPGIILDTGKVNLIKGDIINLKARINYNSLTKFTGTGTTATTVNVRIGTNYGNNLVTGNIGNLNGSEENHDNSLRLESPYYLIKKVKCASSVSTTNLYWQPNKNMTPTTTYVGGKPTISPNSDYNGVLTFGAPNIDMETQYIPPIINIHSWNSLPFVDLNLESNTIIPQNLVRTTTPTNNWAKQIEMGGAPNLKINANKLLVHEKGKLYFNLPIPRESSTTGGNTIFTPPYTFIIKTILGVKGTKNTFTILNGIVPTAASSVNSVPISTTSKEIMTNLYETASGGEKNRGFKYWQKRKSRYN